MEVRAEFIKVVCISDDDKELLPLLTSVKLESTIMLPFLNLLIVKNWNVLTNDSWILKILNN